MCLKSTIIEEQDLINQKFEFTRLKKGESFGENALVNNVVANETIF